MIFDALPLQGSYVVSLEPFVDERGWFARFYCKKEFLQIGHQKEWVQLNHSFTAHTGTIRGMHFQHPPFGEIKLIRCLAGAVYDVLIDLRRNSSTFLKWDGVELSAKNKKMLYIPEGFAHGFQTLSDNTELIYHHSDYYSPQAEGGLRFDDPMIGIEWPLEMKMLSPRDAEHPYLDKNFKGI
jgi:dTDP-4-dehydrorhamnose 3,5-epimerase